ncbi:hypothetical protein MUK70_19530 [Dyadobacter chenwenxiniae]|uniref:DUF1772 domain-containing protein n=1 Tax=Dyadobacter chenwenxiniae TaxID=2906456 RepID=A0A9X1PHI6_9BACT|nr:hypothetical protein [Dyadobacter chenwenxiniae]MCF0061432.1 hypothetical protein [Dyadobacter chenwenxiniae]UON81254.1 hypothetical protein MUK70_19530 [Dyadobacter chenwenxiniae]
MKSIELTALVRIIGITLYFLIAAQGAFYHFGFGKALYNIPAEDFIVLRKAVDPIVRGKFKVLYLSALAVMFIWFLLSDKSAGFLSYAPVLIAFLLLVADMALILKFSEPVNALINGSTLNTETGFNQARSEWLKFILIRGYLSISGFLMLMVHLVLRFR